MNSIARILGLALLMAIAGAGTAGAAKLGPVGEASAQDLLQEALILAAPGETIELAAGTYHLSDGLSLDVDNVTVRGEGPARTVLSFKGQESGSEALLVTSDGVRLEGFAVEDAKGDAIKVKGADGISLVNLRTEWTGGPKSTNGAYGLYPVQSKNVLIDGCVAIAASDAGIYVGQSENIIVRNSRAEYNVAGIEIENSYHADVFDNVATHNTGGILVFDLPDLPQQGGRDVRVFRNRVVANDTDNFAPEGNIVGGVAKGTGIMVMANRRVEIFENELADNGTANLMVVTYPDEFEDPNYDPHPYAISIHHNEFGRGGYAPDNETGALIASIAGTPIPDIVWDGVVPIRSMVLGVPDGDGLYIADNGDADFINLDAFWYFAWKFLHEPTRDLSPHGNSLPPVEPVSIPQEVMARRAD